MHIWHRDNYWKNFEDSFIAFAGFLYGEKFSQEYNEPSLKNPELVDGKIYYTVGSCKLKLELKFVDYDDNKKATNVDGKLRVISGRLPLTLVGKDDIITGTVHKTK